MEGCNASSFNELIQIFLEVDPVRTQLQYYCFNLHAWRLITDIDFEDQEVEVLELLTHYEYKKQYPCKHKKKSRRSGMSFQVSNVFESMVNQQQFSTELLAGLASIKITHNEQAIGRVVYSLKKRFKSSQQFTYLKVFHTVLKAKVKQYEETPDFSGAPGVDVLKFLMEEYGHRQVDLSEVASRSNISEILSGRRNLNLNHIKKLAEIYHISKCS